MAPDDPHGIPRPIDLGAGTGIGPLWGMASDDLNATLLAWPAAHQVAEHVNAELDVFVVVLAGSATLTIDARSHALTSGRAILIPRGARRAIRAGSGGVRYLSIHRRRGLLQIDGAPAP
ncbi:MAG: cupin domain-containing protein [Actinomycetota bacterium]|nr:cupin domain-containing protein [Actinomycetota bacterium]